MKLLFLTLASLLFASAMTSSVAAPVDSDDAASTTTTASTAAYVDENNDDKLAHEIKQLIEKVLESKGVTKTVDSLEVFVPLIDTKRPTTGDLDLGSDLTRLFGGHSRKRRQIENYLPGVTPPVSPTFPTYPTFPTTKKPTGWGLDGYTWGNGKYNVRPWIDFGSNIFGVRFSLQF